MDFDARDKESGTIVFVLGAGCSADCGAPRDRHKITNAFRAVDPIVIVWHEQCERSTKHILNLTPPTR